MLYSYYQYKLNQTNERVNTLISGYKKQFANAESDLAAATAAAKASIQNQLKALATDPGRPGHAGRPGQASGARRSSSCTPSTPTGRPSVGTAFVVSSNATQSLLLTSYTTVKAATAAPGPTVYVQPGQHQHPGHRALLGPPVRPGPAGTRPRASLHALPAATLSPAPQPGDRIYAVSGLGFGRSLDLPGHRSSTSPPAASPRTPPSARLSRAGP